MTLVKRLEGASSNRPSICGSNCVIDNSATFFGNVVVGQGCYIGRNVIIGQPSIEEIKELQKNTTDSVNNTSTCIGNNVIIQPNVVISNNVIIGDNVSIGPFTTIGQNSTVGDGTDIMYRAQIFENIKIGKYCKIGGFICDYSIIGNSVTVMGNLIHSYRNGWIENEDLEDESPIIEDDVIIGFDSLVIGKVQVKSGTYVAAGAIVTDNTPGNCIVKSINQIVKVDDYIGKLRNGKFFHDEEKNENS